MKTKLHGYPENARKGSDEASGLRGCGTVAYYERLMALDYVNLLRVHKHLSDSFHTRASAYSSLSYDMSSYVISFGGISIRFVRTVETIPDDSTLRAIDIATVPYMSAHQLQNVTL